MNKDNFKEKQKWAAFSTVGLMFPTSIAVGLIIGYILDRVFGTSPYLLIVFFLYGVAAGFINLFRVTKKYGKRKQPDYHKANLQDLINFSDNHVGFDLHFYKKRDILYNQCFGNLYRDSKFLGDDKIGRQILKKENRAILVYSRHLF